MMTLGSLICSIGTYYLLGLFGISITFIDVIYLYFLMNILLTVKVIGERLGCNL